MPLSAEQLRLAKRIDEHTNRVLSDEAGCEAFVMSMQEYMEDFGRVMEISTQEEMDELCERYDGFYRFAQFLEEFARGLADGEHIPDALTGSASRSGIVHKSEPEIAQMERCFFIP